MQGTKENMDKVEVNSILHVSHTFHDDGLGKLGIVVTKHSWGCDVRIGGNKGHVMAIAWQYLEHTGGTAVWGEDGKPIGELALPPTHHE